MLQTTNDEVLSTQATEKNKNQGVLKGITRVGGGEVGRSFENLLTAAKSTKFKKPKLIKYKKPKLTKSKKSDLAKANFLKTDFLASRAKKTFIYLQKTFTKALILRYFDLKCHTYIETNAFRVCYW